MRNIRKKTNRLFMITAEEKTSSYKKMHGFHATNLIKV